MLDPLVARCELLADRQINGFKVWLKQTEVSAR